MILQGEKALSRPKRYPTIPERQERSRWSWQPPTLAARRCLRLISAVFGITLLVQFFIAGMSAMTDPDWWIYHKTWVGIFQWLVLPLPLLAWLAGRPRLRRTLLASVPALQIGLQYVLAHRALEGRLPIGIGLHAVNAALMLVVVVILLAGWGDYRR